MSSKSSEQFPKQFIDSANSWEDIEKQLDVLESHEEKFKFESIETGRGPSSHLANIRLFDAPNDYIPEITLYR
jgi:hypothetical protein